MVRERVWKGDRLMLHEILTESRCTAQEHRTNSEQILHLFRGLRFSAIRMLWAAIFYFVLVSRCKWRASTRACPAPIAGLPCQRGVQGSSLSQCLRVCPLYRLQILR